MNKVKLRDCFIKSLLSADDFEKQLYYDNVLRDILP